jgi:allantoicase
MSNQHLKRESMSIEEATVSNMWEIAAIVEMLERLGRIIEMGQGWRTARPRRHEAGSEF